MPSIQEELRRAYQLIRAGDKAGAQAILTQICHDAPENVDAWWLLAHASDDPAQKREALHTLLSIDPFHEKADALLKKLDSQAPKRQTTEQPIKRTTATNLAPVVSRPKQNRSGLVLLALVGVLVMSGIVAFVVMQQGAMPDPTLIPTSAALAAGNLTPAETSVPAITLTPRPSLPPTWTVVPTQTEAVVIQPTITSWIQPSATIATADPALFGDTYWEGVGDGYTMDKYTRSDGRHLRFFEFPVQIYVRGADTQAWQEAAYHAVAQINPYVPVELILEEPEADILVDILSPEAFQQLVICEAMEALGCAGMFDLGDIAGGDRFHRIHGDVYIRSDSPNPYGVFLHELLHALGVWAHSPDEGDIMFPFELGQTVMSQRDVNTLLRLYANPSYAD